ncbi:uncharacterized protein LY79DRAFT_203180 [Colletotrichum navitas]|uniref:Uncharacterized protein n=1 Tax=Colletotrichum navitas TaxID=681940 RepID=A0AAD8QAU8_9PEZI|nr:uncharacterized protein LY79DRAFT_203180 [Colletotrichum navitas]KAK1598915.1 hypothetical protein LY79DRAFT_203180 [Colletotrichum navitas]
MMYFVLFSWPAKCRTVPPPLHTLSRIVHMQRRPMGQSGTPMDRQTRPDLQQAKSSQEESSTERLRGGARSRAASSHRHPGIRFAAPSSRRFCQRSPARRRLSRPRESRSPISLLVQMLTPDRVFPQDTAFVHCPSSVCDGVEEKLTGRGTGDGTTQVLLAQTSTQAPFKGRISIKTTMASGRGGRGSLQLGIVHNKGC